MNRIARVNSCRRRFVSGSAAPVCFERTIVSNIVESMTMMSIGLKDKPVGVCYEPRHKAEVRKKHRAIAIATIGSLRRSAQGTW